MKKNIYILEISTQKLSEVHWIVSSKIPKKFHWEHKITLSDAVFELKVTENENDSYFDFINFFLGIIEDEKGTFKKLKIKKQDITIWRYYKYENQCNMEYLPEQMLRLWKNWVTLCISCMDMAWSKYIKVENKKILKNDWI